MPTKPTSIRLSDRHAEWLARHGRPMSTQLRDDLDAYMAIREAAEEDGTMDIREAVQLVDALQNS